MLNPAKWRNTKSLITILALFIFVMQGYASSTNLQPKVQRAYTLPPLVSAEVESLTAQPANRPRRLQIGAQRALQPAVYVNSRSVPASAWTSAPDGSRTWSVSITSQGSLGLRVHLDNLSLPGAAQIELATPQNSAAPSVIVTAQDVGATRELWTGSLFAEQVLVTCRVPVGVDTTGVEFRIAEISHIYVLPYTQSNLKEGSCHNDVTCYGDWANDAAGVARISFVEHGNTYLCTGCLLASSAQTSAEYFLTADHCVTSQTVASTVEFFWFYQTSSCNGPAPDISSVPHTTGGADRLAGSTGSDFSFLRLKHAAPGGVSFLNWTTDPPGPNETLTCIHHPDGSFKRISFGRLFDSDTDFWAVQWFSGVTEGGSSGSPLLNSSHQVIGHLNGGFAGPGSSCDDPSAPDQFGRFDVTFNSIKRWLTSSGGGGGGGGGTDFSGAKGTYAGLFADAGSGDLQHASGLATITVSSKGKFSAKLVIGAQKTSASGQFDDNGAAQVTTRGGTTLTMQVDPSGASDQINGTISGNSFNAQLTAHRNVFSLGNPAPEAGLYTMQLPGGNDSSAPDGSGYATISVDRMGKIRMSGSLADGVKFSQSTFVASDGSWPLYVPLYGGNGSIQGLMHFSGSDSVGGDITWIRPGLSAAKYYPGGFSVVLNANGSSFVRPSPGSPILNLQDGQVVLSGGDLSQTVSDQFQLNSQNRVVNLGPGKLTLTFSTANGSFSGKLSDPDTGTTSTFRGVVLQNQNVGSGYFLGSSQSGQVTVGP